jgi:uncharacterized repeat protein (TIGR04076 family)
MNLLVRVVEIKGNCPAYKEGDSFLLKEGWLLEADKPLCMHSLAALMPHYNALRISEPGQWGLAGRDQPGKAFVQCLDPYGHTGGGTAVFEITKVI